MSDKHYPPPRQYYIPPAERHQQQQQEQHHQQQQALFDQHYYYYTEQIRYPQLLQPTRTNISSNDSGSSSSSLSTPITLVSHSMHTIPEWLASRKEECPTVINKLADNVPPVNRGNNDNAVVSKRNDLRVNGAWCQEWKRFFDSYDDIDATTTMKSNNMTFIDEELVPVESEEGALAAISALGGGNSNSDMKISVASSSSSSPLSSSSSQMSFSLALSDIPPPLNHHKNQQLLDPFVQSYTRDELLALEQSALSLSGSVTLGLMAFTKLMIHSVYGPLTKKNEQYALYMRTDDV